MKSGQWEIIILKPTSVFLSFLASQLPNTIELPELPLLQTDNTAYLIKKQKNEEETLNEIERHFTFMFRHEICRWLGKNSRHEIEGSFLDFLTCFKFELHSHIVIMEPNIESGKQLLRVRPRSILLRWMKAAVEDNSDWVTLIRGIKLSHLADNATVVVKNFTKLSQIKPFLQHYYPSIFEAEMMRVCNNPQEWPVVDSYQEFSKYFAIEIHTQLIQLK